MVAQLPASSPQWSMVMGSNPIRGGHFFFPMTWTPSSTQHKNAKGSFLGSKRISTHCMIYKHVASTTYPIAGGMKGDPLFCHIPNMPRWHGYEAISANTQQDKKHML